MPLSSPQQALNGLVLSDDESWIGAIRKAASALKFAGLDVVGCADDAVARLVRPQNRYSHILIEPRCTRGRMQDIAEFADDEAGHRPELVLLGSSDPEAPSGRIVASPDSPCLIPAMAEAAPANATKAAVNAGAARFGHMDDRAVETGLLPLDELTEALERGMIAARYQPIVRVSDRGVAGLEVLARLRHPDRGMMPPETFVPVAERAGLGSALTQAVLGRALRDMAASFLHYNGLYLTVNLPLDVLLAPGSLDMVEDQRRRAGLRPSDLLIELTESTPVVDFAGLNSALQPWCSAGYELAIDDIGPGILNHMALFSLPFSTVKLDRDVVHDSATNAVARAYLTDIMAVARQQGFRVIAEGVETEAAWDRMAQLGVDQVQGFLIARPLPARAVEIWMNTWPRSTAAD